MSYLFYLGKKPLSFILLGGLATRLSFFSAVKPSLLALVYPINWLSFILLLAPLRDVL
jgi:uncharacterized membrane protein